MLTMDVFQGDAFTATSLSAAVDKLGYVPTTLSSIPGLFETVPVRTKEIWIEARATAPAVIQTSPRGTAPGQKGGDQRNAKAFNTRRLALASRVYADELQGIRAFGSETELKQLMTEIARRQFKIKRDFALTKEAWLLNLVQGMVSDADGTVIYNWAAEFGQTIPAQVSFPIPAPQYAADGTVRKLANQVRRTMTRNLQGLGGTGFRIMALCGDGFYDALTTCMEVERTFLNWAQAESLRGDTGRAWSALPFADISWMNYRGTDDGVTVTVPTNGVIFFPVGAGIFQMAQAPAERFEFINTLGQEMYSWMVLDKDRDMWADVECYSYSLPVCTMPQALGSGTLTASTNTTPA